MLNLLFALAIGYELQKLIQFNFFFRLRYITSDYSLIIKNKMKASTSVLFKELFLVVFADLGYTLVLLIGLFTINLYFVFGIFLLSILQNIIFKFIKNKTFRKISFTFDILCSLVLLLLSVINSLFWHLDSYQLIKQFFIWLN